MVLVAGPVSAVCFVLGASAVLCGKGGYVHLYDPTPADCLGQCEVLPAGPGPGQGPRSVQ